MGDRNVTQTFSIEFALYLSKGSGVSLEYDEFVTAICDTPCVELAIH